MRVRWTVMALAVGLVFPEPAVADKIHRTCKGEYLYRLIDVNGFPTDAKASAFPKGIRQEIAARGGCGRLVPDRCRRRARSAIQTCMFAHWAARNTAGIPSPACTATRGVTHYRIFNPLHELKYEACCGNSGQMGGSVTVKVIGRTFRTRPYASTGRSACASEITLAERYTLDCAQFEAQGGCDR